VRLYLYVLAAGVAGAALWGWGEHREEAGRNEIRAEWARLALAQSETNRESERLMRRATAGAEDAERQRQARDARIRADLRAHADGLRDDLAAYASGRDAANDSAAACAGRAVTLGGLLDAALRDAEACAADGERDAGIARGLQSAWPEGVTP
jgi:hypothetical protein